MASADLDEEDERRKWERVREKAPGLFEKSGAKAIIESVVSAAIKSSMGL